jgi:hypothetical protein
MIGYKRKKKQDDAGNCIMRISVIYIPRHIFCDNSIKEDKLGGG